MGRDDFELSKMVRTQRSCKCASGHHHGWEDVATGAGKGVAMDGGSPLLVSFSKDGGN